MIVLITVCVVGGCCQNETIVEYYGEQQQLLRETREVNRCSGKRNGQVIWYAPDGHIVSKSTYKDGIMDGVSESYCEENDFVFDNMFYLDGQIHGKCKTYHCETGTIRSIVEYDHGRIMNVLELKDANGSTLPLGRHQDGNGELLKYNSVGDLTARIRIRDGKLNGFSVMITSSGFVDSTFFVNGVAPDPLIVFETYEGAIN